MDKLVKLSQKTIPAFLELYKGAGYPKYAATQATFQNILIQTKKFPEMGDRLELLALNDDWEKDGTFLLRNGHNVFFNTLEKYPFERTQRAIKLLDFKDETVFSWMHDQFRPMIKDILWLKNLETTMEHGATGYTVTKNFALSLPIPK